MSTYDTFIASAPEDGLWVRHLANRLSALDLKVFLDELQIADGDVVVHRIEEALLSSATAILVCSRGAMNDPLVRDEYAAMVTRAAEGAQRIIPVVLHDVSLPPLLAHRSVVDFRSATSGSVFDEKLLELAKAIGAGKKAPEWLSLSLDDIRQRFRPAGPRHARLTVEGDIVTLEADGEITTGACRFAADRLSDLLWSLDETRHDNVVYRGPASAPGTITSAEIALERLGTYIGASFLDSSIAAALCAEIDTASSLGVSLRIGILADERLPANLPWEMMIPPGRTAPLALDPHVEIYREIAGSTATPVPQVSAPLRVLAVLAAPDGDDLDLEDEQRRLHDAFETPRRSAGIHVRVLNEGTLAGIREALLSQEFHILHLACHARPGALLLESDDGSTHRVDPTEFVDALPLNRRPSLVVLSGCSTGLGDSDDLQGVARTLLAAGVPQVLAMTAPITDYYAREFCGQFYRELALAQRPEALPALANARRLIEKRRLAQEPASSAGAEWATPALFLRGLSIPLYTLGEPDVDASMAPIRDPYLGPDIPLRAVGEFVGRRPDQRVLRSALKSGRGVLIHGIGGVGKSSLAAELLRRMRDEAGLIVAVKGRADPDRILAAVAETLFTAAVRTGYDENSLFRMVAAELRLTQTPWRQRLGVLMGTDFAGGRMTLLLDNAESNAATIQPSGMSSIDDADLTEFLVAWVSSPGDGRLIVTSRVPLTIDERLYVHPLGALSLTETRRLMWRLPALNALPAEDQRRVHFDVGGHPQTLEYLDALLRRGATGFTEVRRRIERLLRERDIGDPQRWIAEIGDAGLDSALAESIALTTHDSLLTSLIELVTPEDLAILVGVAVCEIPPDEYLIRTLLIDGIDGNVPLNDQFKALVGQAERLGDEPPGAEAVDQERVETSLRRLTNLGLIARQFVTIASLDLDIEADVEIENDRLEFYSIHPWAAERIRDMYPEQAVVAHRKLAYAFGFRAIKTLAIENRIRGREEKIPGNVVYLLMARRHAYAAGEVDFAVFLLYLIYPQLMKAGKHDHLEDLYLETELWIADNPNEGSSRTRINILLGLSQSSTNRGHYGKAEEYALKAQELADSSDDHESHVAALHQLGECYLAGEQNEKAAAKFRAVIDLLSSTEPDGARLGLAYYSLGNAELYRDIDLSEQFHRQALDLFRRAEDQHNGAKATHSLGNIAAQRGDLATANRLYLEALEVFQQVGDRICTVRCYGGLGSVALQQGQLPVALNYQRKALRLAEQIGDTNGIQRALGELSELMRQRDSRDLELDSLRRALDQALDVDHRDEAKRHFLKLGNTLEELQDNERLAPVVHQARTYFERTGDKEGLIWAYTKTGDIDDAHGHLARAKSRYLNALSMARESNADVGVIGRLLLKLGDLAERQGDYDQAVAFLHACLTVVQEGEKDDVASMIGTRIVVIEGAMTARALSNGPTIVEPSQLASMYASLALNLGHLPGNEDRALLHRIAAYLLTLLSGSSGDIGWQTILLAADVERAGPNSVPRSCDELAEGLAPVSGHQFQRLVDSVVAKHDLDAVYAEMAEQAGEPIANQLPAHLGITWLPPIAAAMAATVMVAEGRRDEYEQRIVPVLNQRAVDAKSRRVISAIKNRIVGKPWRPPLPCDLTHVVITMLDQQIKSFKPTRQTAERSSQSSNDLQQAGP